MLPLARLENGEFFGLFIKHFFCQKSNFVTQVCGQKIEILFDD